MGKKEEAYDPFVTIVKRLNEIADELGLDCDRVSFGIDPDGDHLINVVWSLKAEAVMTLAEKEKQKTNAEFEALTAGLGPDPFEQRVADAKNSIKGLLDKGKK